MRKYARSVQIFPLVIGVAAVSCDDDIITSLPPPEIQVVELKQRPAASVDILWVVDNSQSMVQEQQLLAQNFNRFITSLTTCQGTGVDGDRCDFDTKVCSVSGAPCNPPDYHIGVISTDVGNQLDQGKLRRVGVCVPNVGASPSGGQFVYCQGDNRHCADNAAPENPVCDMGQPIAFIAPTTPGAESAFARAVQVGVTGSGLERGIQAAAMALGRDADRTTGNFNAAPAENSGFLRQDASLFVIFVSDEDDSSFGQISYFYRAFESLKGAGNEGLVSFSAIVGDPDPDGAEAVRGGCPPEPSTPIAAPGTRYVGLAMYSRGLSAEFRVCDEKRLTSLEGSACQRPLPDFPRTSNELGVCVPNGACQTDQDCGNFKCDEGGCIVCENAQCVAKGDRFVELLERNGIFGSICSDDYGSVLDALGFEAAGLQRKFELGDKFADCAQQIECGDGTAPMCVKVNDEVIENNRQSGWVYEPSSNAIFFDGEFVPPTDADIVVSYRLSPGDKANGCDTALQ